MSADTLRASKFSLQQFLSIFSVRARILTAILVPVTGLLFVGFQELRAEYQDYVEAGHMLQLAEIIPVISSLTHEMQKERGKSAGFVSSNGEKFASELIVQRRATDVVLEDFRINAESALQAGLDAEITEEFAHILTNFDKLDAMRTEIDNFQMPTGELAAYYTEIISELIVTVELQISQANEPAIGRQLQALFFLMEAKEYSGIERAVGAGAFSTGEFDLAGYTKFVGVVKLQDFFTQKFRDLGSESLVSTFNGTFRGPVVERVDAYRDLMSNAPFGGSLASVTGEEWFDATTDRINLLKMVDDKATMHIAEAAVRIEAAAAQKLQLVILINAIILFATIVLAVLVVRSITGPIIRLTSTMDTLAGGSYDIEVAGTKNKDELGDMARAVEIFRENGLKIQQFEKDTERQLITAADHSGQISAISKAQAVIEFTATGIITNANENFLKTTGYSINEIMGQHHSMFVDPEYARGADYKAFWQKLGNGEYEEGEYERFDKDGATVWLQASYNPIFGPDGELTKVVKYASNITPRKEATAVLGSSLKLLAEGDLNSRINSPLSGEFEEVREAFNGTVARLTEIVGQLRETSGGLKVATGEILEGANDLSERTTKQAATIEETSATMEQLATTVAENARTAESASAKSGAVSQVAQEGGQVMVEANKAMERITQSSGKISNIIGMIDDIAFQTNLLALNASVEAARAGEAGKGFAVVAVEVRRLAQSAAEASSEVKTLVEQSADEVSNGSKLVADAAEKLDIILEGVRESGSLIDDIARDSKEQASSIDEVNVAVRQMDEMTQHNAALVEETNAAIEQTEVQATELDNIVDVFKVGDTMSNSKRQSDVSTQRQPSRDARGLKETASKAATSYQTSGNAALDTDWGEF